MSLLASLNGISLLLFAAVLAWGATSDLIRLRIPNAVVLTIVAIYPLYGLSAPHPVSWPGALGVSGLVLVIGFALYSFRLFGAGDVKLLAAVALWAGPAHILTLLLSTAIIGAALAMVTASPLRMLLPYMAAAPRIHVGMGQLLKLQIPYGVAIAAGGLIVAAQLAQI